jgi:paraquat-inducible protein B
MRKRVSPTLVGAFVLGAAGLALLAIVLFGSGRFFSQTRQFVCYFSSDVTGLSVGAPVRFHGVHVGAVDQILLTLNPPGYAPNELSLGKIRVPVVIELYLDRIVSLGGPIDLGNPAMLKRLVAAGLRAQLATESLVTGTRYVALDFFPGSQIRVFAPSNPRYPEIPTVPTALQQAQSAAERLVKRLDQLDLEGLVASLTDTVNSVHDLVKSGQIESALAALQRAAGSLSETAASVRVMTSRLDGQLRPLQKSLSDTSNAASAAFKAVQTTLAPDSPLIYRMNEAMNQLAAAARSTQELADYLQRNPSALIRGRATPRDEQ